MTPSIVTVKHGQIELGVKSLIQTSNQQLKFWRQEFSRIEFPTFGTSIENLDSTHNASTPNMN